MCVEHRATIRTKSAIETLNYLYAFPIQNARPWIDVQTVIECLDIQAFYVLQLISKSLHIGHVCGPCGQFKKRVHKISPFAFFFFLSYLANVNHNFFFFSEQAYGGNIWITTPFSPLPSPSSSSSILRSRSAGGSLTLPRRN